MNCKFLPTLLLIPFLLFSCKHIAQTTDDVNKRSDINKIIKSDEEWKSILTDEEYHVLREKGTERPFKGIYWDNKTEGIYNCRACKLPLFDSKTKFKSGTGWPSFYDIINTQHIHKETDYNLGYGRTELTCNRCDAHLGHVFKDGPAPTGLRYCINSVSLEFIKKQ